MTSTVVKVFPAMIEMFLSCRDNIYFIYQCSPDRAAVDRATYDAVPDCITPFNLCLLMTETVLWMNANPVKMPSMSKWG